MTLTSILTAYEYTGRRKIPEHAQGDMANMLGDVSDGVCVREETERTSRHRATRGKGARQSKTKAAVQKLQHQKVKKGCVQQEKSQAKLIIQEI